MAKEPKMTPAKQREAFIAAAREAGADVVGPDAADRLMGKLAKMPPDPKASKEIDDKNNKT